LVSDFVACTAMGAASASEGKPHSNSKQAVGDVNDSEYELPTRAWRNSVYWRGFVACCVISHTHACGVELELELVMSTLLAVRSI